MSAVSVIAKVLEKPAVAEGGRHIDILHRTAQLKANGVERETAINAVARLYPIGSGERKITLKEIGEAYDGAEKLGYKPWSNHNGNGTFRPDRRYQREPDKPKIKAFKASGEKVSLPSDLTETTPIEFLQRIFKPDDFICITWTDENEKPTRDETHLLREWAQIARQPGMTDAFKDKDGVYYCINPLATDDKAAGNREDADVVDHRFLLVELEVPKPDRNAMSPEDVEAACEHFYGVLLASRLPLAAIYTSGGPSVHGLVRVDAKDASEWDERMKKVYEFCATMPGFDKSNKNESRLSRLPGAMRGDCLQALLSLNVGAESYEAWESGLEIDDGSRKLEGCALVELVHETPNEEDTLLGNRYLCRGGGMLIVAPSGHGKSVLSFQATIGWGVGQASFGIKPARPLRTLIVQAEDDRGDCIEMAQIVRHLAITGESFELLKRNIWLEFVNDLTGFEFTQALDQFLSQFPADIVVINPLTAYLGADDKDTKAATLFLRNWLNPVLTKHNAAAVIIHHTPKTNFASTDGYKPSDWMYRGAGAATITNWARAILVIDPGKQPDVYRFIAAKRGKRIGWGYEYPVFETHWAHTNEKDKLLWVPATEAQIKGETKSQKDLQPIDLLPYIPEPDEEHVIIEKIINNAKGKIGANRVRDLMKVLDTDEKIDKINVPRAGARPEVKYRQKEVIHGHE